MLKLFPLLPSKALAQFRVHAHTSAIYVACGRGSCGSGWQVVAHAAIRRWWRARREALCPAGAPTPPLLMLTMEATDATCAFLD